MAAIAPKGDDVAREFILWPCNVQAWRHWMSVQTMWRTDTGVRMGLCVQDVLAYLDLCGVDPSQRAAVYGLLRECELEALQTYADLRAEDDRDRERKRSLRK